MRIGFDARGREIVTNISGTEVWTLAFPHGGFFRTPLLALPIVRTA